MFGGEEYNTSLLPTHTFSPHIIIENTPSKMPIMNLNDDFRYHALWCFPMFIAYRPGGRQVGNTYSKSKTTKLNCFEYFLEFLLPHKSVTDPNKASHEPYWIMIIL